MTTPAELYLRYTAFLAEPGVQAGICLLIGFLAGRVVGYFKE